ncbi:hypothetical protein [Liquorilactobacillus ghanensis]|uniref:hypothetical protein n=1 Tax=Liquorilactobacillus ghanensis TaxID=399370 RepID=UPI0039EA58DA
MSLPEKIVYDLLTKNQQVVNLLNDIRGEPTDFPYVFIGQPNDTFTTFENAPWIRITLISDDTAVYADDNRLMQKYRVQIDFWIEKTDLPNLEKLENLIYDILHSAGIERYYRNHEEDADIDRLEMIQGNFEGFI